MANTFYHFSSWFLFQKKKHLRTLNKASQFYLKKSEIFWRGRKCPLRACLHGEHPQRRQGQGRREILQRLLFSQIYLRDWFFIGLFIAFFNAILGYVIHWSTIACLISIHPQISIHPTNFWNKKSYTHPNKRTPCWHWKKT